MTADTESSHQLASEQCMECEAQGHYNSDLSDKNCHFITILDDFTLVPLSVSANHLSNHICNSSFVE
jgi:hypothetical protein